MMKFSFTRNELNITLIFTRLGLHNYNVLRWRILMIKFSYTSLFLEQGA